MRKAIKSMHGEGISDVSHPASPQRGADCHQTHAQCSFRYRRKLISQRGVRVNIGCADNPTQGWINLDVGSHPGVYFWDCRSDLPFSDGAVAAIYSEHCFEHLDLESEARPFLRECLRCLQPGGVLRIVVPDAGAYLRAYSGPWETLAKMRPLDGTANGWRDICLGQVYQTKMQFMNAIFRQGYEHKYAYDDETLVLVMREAGFPRCGLYSSLAYQ